jgi:AraC-like DNA-binding protein
MFHRDDPKEKLAFHRPQAVPGVELLSAHNSTQGWHVFHERFDVCACLTAFAPWKYRGRTATFVDRSVGLMEPGESHCNTAVHKPAEFKVLMIDGEVLARHAAEVGMEGPIHFRSLQSTEPRLFESVYRFGNAVERDAPALEQESLFAVCASLLLSQAERPPRPRHAAFRQSIERARTYLLERFGEQVTLQELAAVARMSRFHFLREFTREIGIPPHAYHVHVRVEHARKLITRGVVPAEAALRAGFSDQSHLNRHFRQIWGITAGAYAQLA